MPDFWDWHDQNKWGGRCNSKVMQSPINLSYTPPESTQQMNTSITTGASTGATYFSPTIKIEYNFVKDANIAIEKNGIESIISFIGIAGAFKLGNGSNTQNMIFNPRKISFKFPGEFTVNGNRPDGEMVISMNQVTENDSSVYIFLNYSQFQHQTD
jgi:hypothetical protein